MNWTQSFPLFPIEYARWFEHLNFVCMSLCLTNSGKLKTPPHMTYNYRKKISTIGHLFRSYISLWRTAPSTSKWIFFQVVLQLSLHWFLHFSSVQPLSHVWLFVTLWTTGYQASLSITSSRSLLRLMSIESLMPSNHLILCCPLFLPPSIFPSISSLHQVAKVLEFQLQHQSFQWIFRTDFLHDVLFESPCYPRDSQECVPTPKFIGSLYCLKRWVASGS